MERYRILFVDDQMNILQGLGRALHRMCREWDMDFADSGQAALAEMQQRSYHIIITDMKMPEMNGAQLLKRVSELYPGTVRFIFSGHSDHDLILQSVGCAHQYIAKPCNPEILRRLIENSMGLRKLLANENLHAKISELDSLPALPATYNQLLAELQVENASNNKIAEIISRDIAMTAKLLQMINSAFFGLPTHVNNVLQAVNLLGLDTVRALVLGAGVFRQFENVSGCALSIDAIYEHSIAVATAAQKIAVNLDLGKMQASDAMIAGMLHDIGKLILAVQFSEEFRRAHQLSTTGKIPLDHAERRVFGVCHAEIGAHLLSLWGLPDSIVEAVALHHRPAEAPNVAAGVLTAVYLANVFHRHPAQDGQEIDRYGFEWSYINQLGLKDRLTQILPLPQGAEV